MSAVPIRRSRILVLAAAAALIAIVAFWAVNRAATRVDASASPSLEEAAPWYPGLATVDLDATYPEMAAFLTEARSDNMPGVSVANVDTFRVVSEDPAIVSFEDDSDNVCFMIQTGEKDSPVVSFGCASRTSLRSRGLVTLIGQVADTGTDETLLVIAPGGSLFPEDVTKSLNHTGEVPYMVLTGSEVDVFKREFPGSVPTVNASSREVSTMKFDLDLNLDMTEPDSK